MRLDWPGLRSSQALRHQGDPGQGPQPQFLIIKTWAEEVVAVAELSVSSAEATARCAKASLLHFAVVVTDATRRRQTREVLHAYSHVLVD